MFSPTFKSMDYEKLNLKELKKICKERKIKYYSVMNKDPICKLLRKNDKDPLVLFEPSAKVKSDDKIVSLHSDPIYEPTDEDIWGGIWIGGD